jgi:hypothetical protein
LNYYNCQAQEKTNKLIAVVLVVVAAVVKINQAFLSFLVA